MVDNILDIVLLEGKDVEVTVDEEENLTIVKGRRKRRRGNIGRGGGVLE